MRPSRNPRQIALLLAMVFSFGAFASAKKMIGINVVLKTSITNSVLADLAVNAQSPEALADSLFLLYVGAAIGGIGAGVIYGASVGNALKWFPDRRGLAAGLTAAGFGAGSALTVIPIANMIATSGYQAAFLWFGLGQGILMAQRSFRFAPHPRQREL